MAAPSIRAWRRPDLPGALSFPLLTPIAPQPPGWPLPTLRHLCPSGPLPRRSLALLTKLAASLKRTRFERALNDGDRAQEV